MGDYKYLSYCVPIDNTLLNEKWVHKSDEVEKLIDFMKINCDLKILTNAYLAYNNKFERLGKGDVFVFYDSDYLRYIVFDLYHGYTDQNDIIILGIKCKAGEFDQVYKLMKIIYDKCYIKSSFHIESTGSYLDNLTNKSNYPKLIDDSNHTNYQSIIIYVDGKRIMD